jgi:clan AA aspartic protease
MIRGIVEDSEARLRLVVMGPDGEEDHIDAVIDTGYDAWLSLPPDAIRNLGLEFRNTDRGILADGSDCIMGVFIARVQWDGRVRRIVVHEMDATPLVGMSLLEGYELRMDVCFHGEVTIKRLA